jgi:hypothetical protein
MSAAKQPGKSVLPASQLLSESPGPKMTLHWLRTSEFCLKYGVSRCTARRWALEGRVAAVRIPPRPRGRIYILDPQWIRIAPSRSNDPVEDLCILRQCDVALLLGVTARNLRYMEGAGRAKFRLVGHRKLYSLSEVRRLLARQQNGREKVSKGERQASLLRWAVSKLKSTPTTD